MKSPLLIITFMVINLLLTCTTYGSVVKGNEWVVSSRYPEAAKAAALMMEQGGNAFDATVAGLAASGIVDPLMSGLGAEVFALVYSAEEAKVISLNGGGTAPNAATLDWYRDARQDPLKSPLNAGLIPGAFDVWITLLDKWGVMTLQEVLTPAIKLAGGWKVSETMAKVFADKRAREKLGRVRSSKEIYYKKDGSPYLAGELMINQDLADTMKTVVAAERGARVPCMCRGGNTRHQALINARDEFYKGSIAVKFGDFRNVHGNPFTYGDMVSYHALLETPAHIRYRGYDIYKCPSANQGPAELETLNTVEKFNLASLGHNTSQSIHLIAEAINLAYADRQNYLADFNFIRAPLNGLMSKEYAEKRKALINLRRRQTAWPYGNPFPLDQPHYSYDGYYLTNYPELFPRPIKFDREFTEYENFSHASMEIFTQESEEIGDILNHQSTYVCVADKWGNLVYAASSLNSSFGTGVVIKPLGFLLNSGGDSFLLQYGQANSPAPGKRPRSNISPTIVLKANRPYLAMGASNGDGEPQTLAQVLANIVDYKMDIQEAINAPMWRCYSLPASIATVAAAQTVLSLDGRILLETRKILEKMGWKVTNEKEFSHSPDCIVIVDQAKGAKRIAVPHGRTNTTIAQ